MSIAVRAFVQARMSSRRFPGKMLAPFHGQPLIRHVLAAVERVLPSSHIVVATSAEKSDDPLAVYLSTVGAAVFRGPLDDVFERFRRCALEYPCQWILRINGDSPLLDERVLRAVLAKADDGQWDLVTTIFPRSFPRGHNAELIRVSTFMEIDAGQLLASDREHPTQVYYRVPGRFRILNMTSGDPALAKLSFAVDTVQDLHRLEQLSESDVQGLGYGALTAGRR